MSKPIAVAALAFDLMRIADVVAFANQRVNWLRLDVAPEDRTRYQIIASEGDGIAITAYYSIIMIESDDRSVREPVRHLSVTFAIPAAPKAVCPPQMLAIIATACGFNLPGGRDYSEPSHFHDAASGLDVELDDSAGHFPSLQLIQPARDLARPSLH